MKKKFVAISAVAVLSLTTPIVSSTVYANPSDLQEVKDEREEVKVELSKAEKKIAAVLADLNDLNEELDRVKSALEKNQKVMDETETEISNTQEEIDGLEKEIMKLEEAIEKREDILKDRAVSYQKSGGSVNYLEVIFGSKSFGEFISRVTTVNKITESDSNLIKEQEEDKAKVEDKQGALEDKLGDLKAQKVELEGMISTINEQKEQTEKKQDELKDKKENLVALKEELKIEDSKLASIEQSLKTPTVQSTDNGQVASASTSGESKKVSTSSSSAPVASGNLSAAVNAGFGHLGTPYVWGGKSPGGFDCSGFVSWAYSQAGISIPSSTSALQSTGSQVSYSQAKPGDLVFFDTYKKNGHVGIYLGGGKFIGAQNSTGLAVANMNSGYWNDTFKGHVRRVAN